MIHATALQTACSQCNLRQLCMPVALDEAQLHLLDALVSQRTRIAKSGYAFRQGDAFNSLLAVRTGFFKTTTMSSDGHEQITGFHMAGDILGLDGMAHMRHACDAQALEDSQLCVIPLDQLDALSNKLPGLQQHVRRILSREIVHEQQLLLMHSGMRAEQRLAAFITHLLQRQHHRGLSGQQIQLRMSRQDMADYLGLTHETISRSLAALSKAGMIAVQRRHLQALNPQALQTLAGLPAC